MGVAPDPPVFGGWTDPMWCHCPCLADLLFVVSFRLYLTWMLCHAPRLKHASSKHRKVLTFAQVTQLGELSRVDLMGMVPADLQSVGVNGMDLFGCRGNPPLQINSS